MCKSSLKQLPSCFPFRGGAKCAVVDEETLEVRRWLGSDELGGRGLGMALSKGVCYISCSALGPMTDGCRGRVAAFDYHTGAHLGSYGSFSKPSGLCATEDRLLVADRGGNKVRGHRPEALEACLMVDIWLHLCLFALDALASCLKT